MADDPLCFGIRLARSRFSGRPAPKLDALRAELLVGAFRVPLPLAEGLVIGRTRAVLRMALAAEASWVDSPPVVETCYGRLPVLLLERCAWLEKLDPEAGRDADGLAAQLMRAALALQEHLVLVERTWEAIREGVWRTLVRTETIAADLLSAHLTTSLQIARRERDRYLYPNAPQLPRAESDDFKSLTNSLRKCAAARREVDLGAVRREKIVIDGVAIAVLAYAFQSSLLRAAPLDAQYWREVRAADHLMDRARANLTEATAKYLFVLRREAKNHPIVLVMDHGAPPGGPLATARAVDLALRKAEDAIGSIRAKGVNGETVPATRSAKDLSITGLADRLASANPLSVWKLPFFVERALNELPPERAVEVTGLMDVASRDSDAISRSLALFGIDSAMMFAPAGGPVGVGLALAWALMNLGASISEYTELQQLYHATLDPAVLLRGMDHEEASKTAVVMDLFGLMVW